MQLQTVTNHRIKQIDQVFLGSVESVVLLKYVGKYRQEFPFGIYRDFLVKRILNDKVFKNRKIYLQELIETMIDYKMLEQRRDGTIEITVLGCEYLFQKYRSV